MKRVKRIIIMALLLAGGYYLTLWILGKFSGTHSSTNTSDNTRTINTLHNESINIVLTQAYIMEGIYQHTESSENDGSTLGYIRSLDKKINVDIVDLLKSSNNKSKTLNDYIRSSETLILEAQGHLYDIENKRQIVALRRIECQKEKAISDQQFYRGLSTNNTKSVEQGLQQSQKAGACDVQARIEYNALGAMISKLKKKRDFLSEKKELLANHQDLITQNFDYFQDQQLTLETLANMREKLSMIEKANAILQ